MKNEDKIRTFKDLKAWQEGHKLVLDIYVCTRDFPKNEMFALTSQMRRSAVSITSNIAEGFSRDSYADKAHFYVMAHGSLTELENQIIIAKDVGYIKIGDFESLIIQAALVYRIIAGLIHATKERK
jgi:four helix bundle protein